MKKTTSPIAIVDIGTNTFNLLIKDPSSGKLLLNTKIPVKLGQGGLGENRIAQDAFDRGIYALSTHRQTALQFGVQELYAFATSAVRSTTNGSEFVAKAKETSNIRINVIDGIQEAQFIAKGVGQAINLHQQDALIMDIGGGSTEFISIKNGTVKWMQSYLLGASRIIEQLKVADPLSIDDIINLENLFNTLLVDLQLQLKEFPVKTLIGSSGSFDTLYDLIAHQEGLEVLGVRKTVTFSISSLQKMTEKLIKLPLADRLAIPGMLAMRADMMPISAVFINYMLQKFDFQEIKLSTFSLKEGVFETLKTQEHSWQVSLL